MARRLVLAGATAVALVAAGVIGHQWWTTTSSHGSVRVARVPAVQGNRPAGWFAGYTDVTTKPTFEFESTPTGAGAGRDVVLAFIVSARGGPCTPSWGTALTLDEASASLGLDRRIARMEQAGRRVAVSFGGQLKDELATTCMDVDKLAAAYASVLDRYHVWTIDLDVEGAKLGDHVVGQRRAAAIRKLQLDRKAIGKPLAIWLTLPVSPGGLTEEGQAAVGEMLSTGVDLAGVNAMTMDYGSSRAQSQSMLDTTTGALTAMHGELKILFSRAGKDLSSPTVWSKIGATPMIGQNDVPGEVFGLDAAKGLNEFALSHGVGRVSMWSLNRDVTCGPNQVDLKRASAACSGVSQGGRRFADLLAAGMAGRLSAPG